MQNTPQSTNPAPSPAQFASTLDAPSPASDPLVERIRQRIDQAGGWIGFDAFMALALYAPGLGYYSRGDSQIGALPQGMRDAQGQLQGAGSDFVTAPELPSLFGHTLARQVAQALQVTATSEVWEFGAGTGALALQVLDALHTLGQSVARYTIVDLSGTLRARQQATLARYAGVVHWVDTLPARMRGVVLGNEVLDAMPVQMLARVQGQWVERGVVWQDGALAWGDRPTTQRPPLEVEGAHDYVTEIHPQGEAFVRTLAQHLEQGAVLLLDYGFPEAEYYHPQRHMGTVMCHQRHQADGSPLDQVGHKDITAHVNFTGIAVAAQEVGLEVLGYTSQAQFLLNCGIAAAMESLPLPQRVAALKLLSEHEMGELFKVIAFTTGPYWEAMGFARGDRTGRL